MPEHTQRRSELDSNSIDYLRTSAEVLSPREKQWVEESGKVLLNEFIGLFGKFIPKKRLDKLMDKEPYKRLVVVDEPSFKSIYDMWDTPGDDNGSYMSEIGVRFYTRSTIDSLDLARFVNESGVELSCDYYQKIIDLYGDDVHKVFFGKKIATEKKRVILAHFTKEMTANILPAGQDDHFENRTASSRNFFKRVRAIAFTPDLMIVIKDERKGFDQLHKNAQKRIIKGVGNEKEARDMVTEILMYDHIIHEMIHLFEPQASPNLVS